MDSAKTKKTKEEKKGREGNPRELFIGLILLIIVLGMSIYLIFGLSHKPVPLPISLSYKTYTPLPSPSPTPSPTVNPGQPPPGQPPPGHPPPGHRPPPGKPPPEPIITSSPKPVIINTPLAPKMPAYQGKKVTLFITCNIPARVFVDDGRGVRCYGVAKPYKNGNRNGKYFFVIKTITGKYKIELRKKNFRTVTKDFKFSTGTWEYRTHYNLFRGDGVGGSLKGEEMAKERGKNWNAGNNGTTREPGSNESAGIYMPRKVDGPRGISDAKLLEALLPDKPSFKSDGKIPFIIVTDIQAEVYAEKSRERIFCGTTEPGEKYGLPGIFVLVARLKKGKYRMKLAKEGYKPAYNIIEIEPVPDVDWIYVKMKENLITTKKQRGEGESIKVIRK